MVSHLLNSGKIIPIFLDELPKVEMLLSHNLGSLPDSQTEQIKMLSIEQLESLCAVAFDFQNLSDLTAWLSS